jgi:hypothetical protein
MASTRNNNTPNDYCLQQRGYNESRNYLDYQFASTGRAYKNALPEMGINPSHMPRDAFSKNSIDIETALLGIGSTNLVNPQAQITPNLTILPEVSYFDKLQNLMPEPLVIEKNQRPFPIPK